MEKFIKTCKHKMFWLFDSETRMLTVMATRKTVATVWDTSIIFKIPYLFEQKSHFLYLKISHKMGVQLKLEAMWNDLLKSLTLLILMKICDCHICLI